jgi:hypothetical protein
MVREATPEEVAAQPAALPPDEASLGGKAALWVLGVLVFGAIAVLGSRWSFRVGPVAGCGYLIEMAGYLGLLVLVIRECRPDAILFALVVPFFLWYFAWQRWDVAKWPFLVNIVGLAMNLVGVAAVG